MFQVELCVSSPFCRSDPSKSLDAPNAESRKGYVFLCMILPSRRNLCDRSHVAFI